jgi:hypothetical protein
VHRIARRLADESRDGSVDEGRRWRRDYAWAVGSDIFSPQRYHGFASDEPNESNTPPLRACITPVQRWK